MSKHILHITDDLAKQRLVNSLQHAPVRDERGRSLMVVVYRVSAKEKPLRQKGLFYAWLEIIANHVGCTAEEMKRDLKDALLPMVESVNRLTGEIFMERQHTEDLDHEGWANFLTRMEVLCKEQFGITLPPPMSESARMAYAHHQHAAAAA